MTTYVILHVTELRLREDYNSAVRNDNVDRFVECVRRNGLFATFTESGWSSVRLFRFLVRNFLNIIPAKIFHIPAVFLLKMLSSERMSSRR